MKIKDRTTARMMSTSLLLLFLFVAPGMLRAQTNDVPITTQTILTGNYQQVISGITFYPDLTANNFDIVLPTCSGGATPTVAYAYLNWQGRFRAPDTQAAPVFDDDLDVQVNTGSVTTVTASFFPVGNSPSSGNFTRHYFTGFAEVTALIQASIVAGTNTISVSDFNLPATGMATINQNFGVGLTIIYECPEFPTSTITVGAGVDFFFCRDGGLAGQYSELTIFTFPTTTADVTGTLEGLVGGQANANAPFRGGNICYLTGSGTPPATTMNPPEPLVVNDPNAVCSTNPTWTSSLGLEWDSYSVPVTIPAGSNYLIIQGNSEDNTDASGNVLANCGSLHSSTTSLVVQGNLFCVDPTPVDAPFTICADETATDLTANDVTVLDGDMGTVTWYDGDPATTGTLLTPATAVNLNMVTDLFARVTATASSCTADVDVTVTINPLPTLMGGEVCVDDMITLTGSGTANATDPYVSDDPAVATVTDAGVVTGVAAGTANITYTDDNGCTISAVVTVTSLPVVTVATPATLCITQAIDLTMGASITPTDLGGTWSSSSTNGTFTTGNSFTTATTYVPGSDDIAAGQVTLTLTTNDPAGPCGTVATSVTFTIQKVDCGTFPWGGE